MEPPSKRSCQREEEDERKTGWFDLPYEMRRMILDTLEIGYLMKFSCCSKQCSEEVWESKNYFKEIYLEEGFRSTKMTFTSDFGMELDDYSIEFTGFDTETPVTFTISDIFDTYKSTTVNKKRNDAVLEYLQMFLRRIGKNLRVLHIDVKSLMRNKIVRNVQIRNLSKLDRLKLSTCYTQNTCPLKMGLVDMEQLCNVKSFLEMAGMKMTFEQLLQIKADDIRISYATLTPEDLNNYIRMWKNGELHKNFKSLRVRSAYNYTQMKRKIELNLDEFEVTYRGFSDDILFILKSPCEELKHLTGHGFLDGKGLDLFFQVK